MTEGPQQPHNPQQSQQGWQGQQGGWQNPPAQPAQPNVLRGNVVGEPQQHDQSGNVPSWNAPADWAPPTPGQGTRGPSTPVPPPVAEPDWSALADESETRARRRKLLLAGGGVLAVTAIAGIVATAVVSSSGHSPAVPPTPSASTAEALPPQSPFPSIVPTAPYSSLDFLSSAKKDTAPLSADTLFFPAKRLLFAGHVFAKTAIAQTGDCSAAAASALSTALATNGCRQVFRATFTEGKIAVTVGVAVFDSAAQAEKVKNTAQYIRPLNGGGVADFCHAVSCRLTSSSIGRYAYYTIAGLKNGQTITASDTAAKSVARAISDFAFRQILQRGDDQANADAASG